MHEEKVLFIVRHGKSSWENENIPDIDRPLNDRGIHNAYEMAEKFKKKFTSPGLILSSPANRALHTAIIYSRVLNISTGLIQIEKSIYDGNEENLLRLIKNIKDTISSLMLFGHNPRFTNLANYFATEQIDNIPTAGFFALNFKTDTWSRINKSNVIKEYFDYPKK